MVRQSKLLFLLVMIAATQMSCVGAPPIPEYNRAATAINSAQSAGATRFAAGYLTRATDSYKAAKKFYDDRDYSSARIAFRQAQLYAERAENLSVLKRAQTGEVPE